MSYGATKLGESITNIEVGSKSKLQTNDELSREQQVNDGPSQVRSGELSKGPDQPND